MERGRAQCVLGNHDLNILLAHEKSENGWFWGKKFFDEEYEDGACLRSAVIRQVLANETIRRGVLGFFESLPIALEREDLRVVHASWDDQMIELARLSDNAVRLYQNTSRRSSRKKVLRLWTASTGGCATRTAIP